MKVSEIISESLDDLVITNDVTLSYRNGYNGELTATRSNKIIGYLRYSIYNDIPKIIYIYVEEEYRRSKVALRLLKELQKLSPDEEIDWGLTSDSGSKLRRSIDYIRRPNLDIIEKKMQLKSVIAKLEKMNDKLEQLQATDIELARKYINDVGDHWNELNDLKSELENELYLSKGEYSKIIP
jgi:hypothetical protein